MDNSFTVALCNLHSYLDSGTNVNTCLPLSVTFTFCQCTCCLVFYGGKQSG